MNELEPYPCAHCGSKKIVCGDDRNEINELYGYVVCVDCRARMEAFLADWESARKLAVKKWNKRMVWIRGELCELVPNE